MSEARAITNIIGNGVATVVISRWEKELDQDALQAALNGRPPSPTADEAPLLTDAA